MQRLRRQVDTIDLKLLKLLQQRTKLSGEIGRTKRRHGAEIYAPDRERELLARVAGLAAGKLHPAAVMAIFREILSSSRAAQDQPPMGLLKKSADVILLLARVQFGACDRFVTKESWRDLARELGAGRLALGLLTLPDLASILSDSRARISFLKNMNIVGEFSPDFQRRAPIRERVFVVKPRDTGKAMTGTRALILIECKITASAVKSLLTSMPYPPIHSEHVTLAPARGGKDSTWGLVGLTFRKSVDSLAAVEGLGSRSRSGPTRSILGIYPLGGDYGG